MTQHEFPTQHPDSDEHKGVVEDDLPHLDDDQPKPHDYMSGQIGHRNADELTEDNDTDFPEPDPIPEHSGEHE